MRERNGREQRRDERENERHRERETTSERLFSCVRVGTNVRALYALPSPFAWLLAHTTPQLSDTHICGA